MQVEFDYQTALEDFQDDNPVWRQIWTAIVTEFMPNKRNWFGTVFSFTLGLILTYIIVQSVETVSLTPQLRKKASSN